MGDSKRVKLAGNQKWPIASNAYQSQIDGLRTMDKNLYKQQNLLTLKLFLIVLQAVDNKIPTLLKGISSINTLLNTSLQPGVYLIRVEAKI